MGTGPGSPPLLAGVGGHVPVRASHDDGYSGIGDRNETPDATQPASPDRPSTPRPSPHTQPATPPLPETPLPYDERNVHAARQQQRRTKHAKPSRKTAATIRIATWNMRGRGDNKWKHINQIVRQKKLGILCLQETHLTHDHIQTMNKLFGKRLHIINTATPGKESTTGGAAIIINKELVPIAQIATHELVPGRAILTSIHWHDTKTIHILNVYAPNNHRDNETFWNTIREQITRADSNLPIPDIMLGDFNIVEDAIDRNPPHADHLGATQALTELRTALGLIDGWRHLNPTERIYTYHQPPNNSRSRLDRIYLAQDLLDASDHWSTFPSAVPSDHQIVSFRLEDLHAPFIGKGRWTVPLTLLDNEDFLDQIAHLGATWHKDSATAPPHRDPRQHHMHIQTTWQTLKRDIIRTARHYSTTKADPTANWIKATRDRIRTLASTTDPPDPLSHQAELHDLEAQLAQTLRDRYDSKRTNLAAKDAAYGSYINKYFTSKATTKTPRDLIYSLSRPHPDGGDDLTETRSDRMAQLARDYHDHLQATDPPPNELARQHTIAYALNHITTTLTDNQRAEIDEHITPEHVNHALNSTAPGKATGPDGIPYELWKRLRQRHEYHLKYDIPNSFDVSAALATLLHAIHTSGVNPDTDFTLGWIWHKYKDKGSKRSIKNYRPITLLNTDYKLLTKILAFRTALAAQTIIHPDQAGFIPERSIFDQTRLAQLVPDYCETFEENGALIALDQEKAYDRIRHDYLWAVLHKFGLPRKFIDTIRSLYQSASSYAIINGENSTPFTVTRGVRQGDPISCILFDLAIEPLANMLRQSSLHGLDIPNTIERLLTRLFADDTAVFLSEHDTFQDLEHILLTWCIASGARFNIDKTAVIPLGTPQYRQQLLETRRLQPHSPPLPTHARIIPDGDSTRYLGAWIGNHAEHTVPWTNILDKISLKLDRWAQLNLTLDEARLVISMVVGGHAQYITKTHGMPPHILQTIEKRIRNFIWHGDGQPPVGLDTLYLPKTEGGIQLMDLQTRNTAIAATWLTGYLNLSDTRPTWAFLADALLAEHTAKAHDHIPRPLKINTFLQTWQPLTSAASTLPSCLKLMIKTAKICNLALDAIQPTRSMKNDLPAWYLHDIPHQLHHRCPKSVRACLELNHHVTTLGDLTALRNIRKRNNDLDRHHDRKNCACQTCKDTRAQYNCVHPNRCERHTLAFLADLPQLWNPTKTNRNRDNLSLTPNRIRVNAAHRKTNDQLTFDPSVTLHGSLADCFRIFVDPDLRITLPTKRYHFHIPSEAVTVYTDGSCVNNGALDAIAGAGIYYGPQHEKNTAARIHATHQSNQLAELAAIYHVARTEVGCPGPLHIITDSKYAINTLTQHLERLEQTGFTGVKHADWIQAIASWLRKRGGPTTFQWIKGHSGVPSNEEADRLAASAPDQPDAITLRPVPYHGLLITGIQLPHLTQRLAYAALRARKTPPLRTTTARNLDLARHAIHDWTHILPTDASIWQSTRHPDLPRTIRQWLWKHLHNAYRIGHYWTNIPQYEHRALCSACHTEETLSHILLHCPANHSDTVWTLARLICEKKTIPWRQPTTGTILASGLLQVMGDNHRPKPGPSRLLRIVMTESAYLLWLVRCERIFQRTNPAAWHSPQELHHRWHTAINRRLALDQALTNKSLLKHRALPTKLVLTTWTHTLADERHNIHTQDWIGQTGVLVSIRLPELDQPP